jgi:hypothetical protein
VRRCESRGEGFAVVVVPNLGRGSAEGECSLVFKGAFDGRRSPKQRDERYEDSKRLKHQQRIGTKK